jgi:DNA repair protein SbcD/Mre11
VKFVHAADLHIDSPLCGLERYEGAPVERVRGATRRALENLVELCLAEDAAFLLLAGDIFDGDWRDYGTGLFFIAQMARLRQAGIAVYLIRGNHDAASQVTKYLPLPEMVHEFGWRHAETRVLDAHGVAIHGQSFGTRAVTEDLSVAYPEPVRGLFNIGLLHTSADGRPGHEPYAPCSADGLAAKGYEYWALGHVHAREVLSRDPWIVFPGNLQGRHAREIGPKGATVVTVRDGRVADVAARALDVVRWAACEVDVMDAGSADDAIQATRGTLESAAVQADGRLVAARVTLRATADVHRALLADTERWTQRLRAVALDAGGDNLWIERVQFVPGAAAHVRDLSATDEDAVVQFATALRALRDDDAALTTLMSDDLADLRRKLPAELREGADGLRIEEPATLRRLVDEVESLVVGRLTGRRADGEIS